jgi:L-threonylcarbamoyladenylate synthase
VLTTEEIRDCLRGGGVVLLPTDTVYGLAVHPERDDAADRLFAMKRRPRTRNLPIMVASTDDLPALGAIVTEPAARLLAAFSPGPLTLALGLRPGVAPEWLAGRVEIGVRIPAEESLLALLANAHAQATRESIADILSELDSEPDLVIDGGIRDITPSTLVNCNLPTPVIERPGVLSAEQIEKVLR